MSIVGYVRVSTDEQAKSGLGLAAQRLEITRYAKASGVPVASLHEDRGFSGSLPSTERPGLTAAMSAVVRGDILVVAKRDRLSRDALESALLERALSRKGVRIVSTAGEGTADDRPESVFMRRVIDAVGEFDLGRIRGRIKAALAVKKARGELVGSVPYGFKIQHGRLAERDDEQEVMRIVMKLHGKGLSVRDIAAELAMLGRTSRKGNEIGKTQVHRLVRRLSE